MEAQETGGGIDWDALPASVVAWVRVPGTTVDYPIVQGRTESPDFYLTHDAGGERSAWGAPYIDAGCAQGAESPLVIGRALDSGCEPVSFLMEPQHISGKGAEILARCDADIPVYTAPLEVLTQLTGFHLTRGMLCAMRRPALPSVAEVCALSLIHI